MKKILVLIGLCLTTLAYSQSDTVLFNYDDEALKGANKLLVKRLSLADIVAKQKSIPSEILQFKNLEFLSLRPVPVSFAKPRGGAPCIIRYTHSMTKTIPNWIVELESLEELDLIGINKVNYKKVLPQLTAMNSLTKLSIDPDNFDDALIEELIKLKKLKSLKVRASVTDEQLREMKNGLPDCKIVTGIYADY